MVRLTFVGDGGNETAIDAPAGERLFDVLLGAHVPPPAVVVTADGVPVGDDYRLDPGRSHEVWPLEGYDLEAVRDLYRLPESEDVHTRRRLSFGDDGSVSANHESLDSAGLEAYVERTVRETVTHYGLVEAGDTMVVGLSGGLDSSALLAGLDAVAEELPPFDVVAVTVEEPWPGSDGEATERASAAAEAAGVEHSVVELDEVEAAFGLDVSLLEVMERLHGSEYAEQTVPVFDSVVTRMLERHAEAVGAERVALGVHSTELTAGLLSSAVSGYDVAKAPAWEVGDLAFVYPLALLSKRELALYHHARTGEVPAAGSAHPWPYQSEEQSFYFFLADVLQSYWPGIQHWLTEIPGRNGSAGSFGTCRNCGKTVPARESPVQACTACTVLAELGFVDW